MKGFSRVLGVCTAAAFIGPTEIRKWARVVKEAGLKVE